MTFKINERPAHVVNAEAYAKAATPT